jgi:hypothetical protein
MVTRSLTAIHGYRIDMGTKDPRVDARIAGVPDFARPILTHLLRVVHWACPDVERQ